MALIPRRFRRLTLVNALLLIIGVATLVDFFQHFASRIHMPDIAHEERNESHRIFIASTHWNNEDILRKYWNDQVIQITELFGAENVFISIYESGSWDNSKGALRELDERLDKLGVARKIVLDPTTHADEIAKSPTEFGWIETPRNTKELRRIPYLSSLRNRSLDPLLNLQQNGTIFDKILFLNDVVFNMDDVTRLLDTNGGHYAAACSLDFSKPPKFYDTFALRDSDGHEAVMQTWPYFRSRVSRKAMASFRPVKVQSCWNGMVFMNADPFYDTLKPLRFRGISDSLARLHLEGSECCLMHQDNPLSATQGVWINPDVRVGYSKAAYDATREEPAQRSFLVYLGRVWENRICRWSTSDWFKRRVVQTRISTWQSEGGQEERFETGHACLINEMQVLARNGWAHL